MHTAGRITPSCTISVRLRSPPERSTLSGRRSSRASRPMALASLSMRACRVAAGSSPTSPTLPPAAAAASSECRLTPGTSTGFCSARNSPARARSQAGRPVSSRPSMVMEPAVTSVPGRPMSAWASVLLPEPLGPMITWTSPLRTVRSMPCRTSLPPAAACRPAHLEHVVGGLTATPRRRCRRPP